MQGWSVDWFGKPRKALQSCRTLLGYANRTTCQPCKENRITFFSVSPVQAALSKVRLKPTLPSFHAWDP